jgi:hypothetical protein
LSIVGVYTEKPRISGAFFCPFTFFISALPLPKIIFIGSFANRQIDKLTMEPRYKVNPLTGELQEYYFEYNGILALRNFTAKVEDERLILHAADDVNFSILEALVSEVEINGVVYDNPTAAQEALTRLTFNQNRPVLLDKTLKDLILGAVQKVEGKGLSSNDFTNAYKQQLDALEDYDIELDESTTELKFKKGNNVIKRISLMFLDDEGTKLVYNKANKTLELRDKRDNLLTSIPVSHFVSNIPTSIVVQNGKIKLMSGSEVIGENTISYNDLADKPELNFASTNHTHNFDDIQGKPNNLATTENVKTAVEGIQIGGRNLLRNSNKKITNSNYNIAIYQLTEEPKDGEVFTVTIKGKLGVGKTVFAVYNSGDFVELSQLYDKGNGIYQNTFNWRTTNNGRIANNKTLFVWTYDGSVTAESTIEWIKLERGNKATDWTPAVEETINLWERLLNSPYGETILSNLPIIIREIFLDNTEGSNTNLWTANNELNVGSRNIGGYSKVRSSGYNINGKDNNYIVLAGGNSIHKNLLLGRKGYISDGGTLNQQDHSNSTIFVRSGGNFELSPLESLTSCSFIKVFDGGNVTFTCEGKTIIMKGDTQFNGSKGSTAVVSIHDNDCYIRISNV